MALMFLRANDFDVDIAVKKYMYFSRRTKPLTPSLSISLPLIINGLINDDQQNRSILASINPGQVLPQGCICLPQSIDRNGSPIVIIATRFFSGIAWMDPDEMLAAAIYLAFFVLESQPSCLRNGVTLLIDLQETPWSIQTQLLPYAHKEAADEAVEESQMLVEAIRMVMTFFRDCFPIKYSSIILYKPWWYLKWLQLPAIIVSSEEDLWKHIAPANLPMEFGGSLVSDRGLLVRNLMARATGKQEDISSFPFKKAFPELSKAKRIPSLAIKEEDPWSITYTIISAKPERRCELSKSFTNCTLEQIKSSLSQNLKL